MDLVAFHPLILMPLPTSYWEMMFFALKKWLVKPFCSLSRGRKVDVNVFSILVLRFRVLLPTIQQKQLIEANIALTFHFTQYNETKTCKSNTTVSRPTVSLQSNYFLCFTAYLLSGSSNFFTQDKIFTKIF